MLSNHIDDYSIEFVQQGIIIIIAIVIIDVDVVATDVVCEMFS